MPVRASDETRRRALAAGISIAYHDIAGSEQEASEEALLAGLAAIESKDPAADRRPLEPVIIAWEGAPVRVPLRISSAPATLECTLADEAGGEFAWAAPIENRSFDLPQLALGYHQLTIDLGGELVTSRVIAAPRRAFQPGPARTWGVFTPIYALRSAENAGAGDLADLARFGNLVAQHGARFVGTLPLLATFLDEPFEPSPYAPVSRTCWNEFYARPDSFDREAAAALRAGEFVDYRAVASLKRRALEAQMLSPGAPWTKVEAFVACNPRVERYARFLGYLARVRTSWHAWPAAERGGEIALPSIDQDEYRYHLFAQWFVSTQLAETAGQLADRELGLYLDFPVGVHPDGFDAWSEQDLFADGLNIGAPPDGFYAEGQDWGFRPILPQALREAGYQPFIDALRHHMSVASMLRIDHVMGLHRLYWVPHGRGAKDGIYVSYPAEELYAVICLESVRHEVMVVGEDLGTVPPGVREAMNEHGLHRMYVAQIELRPDETPPLPTPSPSSIASLNTHDMAPFAGYWGQASWEQRERFAVGVGTVNSDDALAVARRAHEWLSDSPAAQVMVTLEDTWGETRSQNIPGTSGDVPNWRGKHRYSLEVLPASSAFQQLTQSMSGRGEAQ